MRDLVTSDLEHAPCGFLIFSDNGTITGINTTLMVLLGYSHKEELTGKSIETLFTIAGRIFYQTHFYPLIKLHGQANEIFFSLRTKEKGELPVMCNAVRKERDGQCANHCVFVPVTERRKYEEELLNARRQAEKALEENHDLVIAKRELEIHSIELDRQLNLLTRIGDDISQFSKVLSHDLQESIRKIALFSDMVGMELKQMISPERLRTLGKISSECARLRQLAADLDKFIGLNIYSEELNLVDMNRLVQNAFAEVATDYGTTSFVVEPLPEIEGFEKQMKMLFTYIFVHAAERRRNDTSLAITVECSIVQQNSFRTIKGKYRYIDFAKIVIIDNADHGSEIEGPIFKLQKRTGSKHINFSLPFCKKIVDNHHGDIHMASTGDGGAQTTILLPVTHALSEVVS